MRTKKRYTFKILFESGCEEIERTFEATSEKAARRLAEEWAGPIPEVGECCNVQDLVDQVS
jgi:hypothetical protein